MRFDEFYNENIYYIFLEGDGRQGYPRFAPYNAIHVGAASPEKPHTLISQLAAGGRLLVPVGPEGGSQYMMQVKTLHFHL